MNERVDHVIEENPAPCEARGVDLTTLGANAAIPSKDHEIFRLEKMRVPPLRETYDPLAFAELEMSIEVLREAVRKQEQSIISLRQQINQRGAMK